MKIKHLYLVKTKDDGGIKDSFGEGDENLNLLGSYAKIDINRIWKEQRNLN